MEDRVFSVEQVAHLCHEANKALCEMVLDLSQPSWAKAPSWQKESAMDGVRFHLAHPDASPSVSHDNWRRDKVMSGWTYGETKDEQLKLHPCMVDFVDLPPEQQAKDHLFAGIVNSLRDFIVE